MMDYYTERNEWIAKGEDIAEKVCLPMDLILILFLLLVTY